MMLEGYPRSDNWGKSSVWPGSHTAGVGSERRGCMVLAMRGDKTFGVLATFIIGLCCDYIFLMFITALYIFILYIPFCVCLISPLKVKTKP